MESTFLKDHSIIERFKKKGKAEAVQLCCELYKIELVESIHYVDKLSAEIKKQKWSNLDKTTSALNKFSNNILGCGCMIMVVVFGILFLLGLI